MVEKILKIVLILVVIGFAYWLYKIIQDPIQEQKRNRIRQEAVIERMELIRAAQFAHKDVRGKYASTWDSLLHVVKNEEFTIIKTIGDPNDTTVQVVRDTSFIAIRDSILPPSYPLDSLPYAPQTDQKFKLDAGTINERGVNVHVFEVKDVQPINDKTLTLGSMSEANYSGNWK